MGAVTVVVAGDGRILAAGCIIVGILIDMDGVVPAIVVVSLGAVPAAVLLFEGGVVPEVAGVLPADDGALALEAEVPDFGGVDFGDVPFDGGGGLRRRYGWRGQLEWLRFQGDRGLA